MVEVFIQTDLLNNKEINELSTDTIAVKKVPVMGFGAEPYILVTMELLRTISFNAAYDSLKYILFSVNAKLMEKRSNKKTIVRVIHGDDKFELSTEFPVSEETIKEISLTALDRMQK